MAKRSGPQKKKGGNKRIGRHAAKYKYYRMMRRREHNKLRRIIKSNGLKYARRWAKKAQCLDIFADLTKA
jgi:hypothetical protein